MKLASEARWMSRLRRPAASVEAVPMINCAFGANPICLAVDPSTATWKHLRIYTGILKTTWLSFLGLHILMKEICTTHLRQSKAQMRSRHFFTPDISCDDGEIVLMNDCTQSLPKQMVPTKRPPFSCSPEVP